MKNNTLKNCGVKDGLTAVRIEVSSRCQLKCPICPTARGVNRRGVIGWGDLSPGDYGRFLKENQLVTWVELSNYGEMFLNPHLSGIMDFSGSRNIILTAMNGTNLNIVDDDQLDALVKNGLRVLTVSIDGASAETYRKYRMGGNCQRVINNINKINFLKENSGSEYPLMEWQYVVFGHNEDEIIDAYEMSKKLKMLFYPKLNWDNKYSPVKKTGKKLKE